MEFAFICILVSSINACNDVKQSNAIENGRSSQTFDYALLMKIKREISKCMSYVTNLIISIYTASDYDCRSRYLLKSCSLGMVSN